ncbi:hypothetical protein [Occallatibacter riparius]|uniref:Beta-galactosidase trimerisation domain-containing protein n=1 Tax=Occallatibacter riparius TaxID=1002689 RepID=A0A9J7BVC5_9BACT|nr:hypothetical protein [Occallatibacter riparius]UWZ86631.1 hypothetical protein MOP44_11955 [Occallatibacter riparius]
MSVRARLILSGLFALAALFSIPARAAAPAHDQFKVAVYIPVFQVERMMKDPAYMKESWAELSSQVRVDKVYIETYRSGTVTSDAALENAKAFFKSQGVETAGGIAYVGAGDNAGSDSPDAGGEGQFISMCYTDPRQRDLVKQVAEQAARHFDEIMLDDFFFSNTKRDSDISARGSQSWTAFRLKLMADVSRDLVLGPARAVNPKAKVIIKFPNWYEHFPANGYDLDVEPKLYDGIYTGTETRDPEDNDQHLQQYESYEIVRYFDNVAADSKKGTNGGGWVDTYDSRTIDRYAEQLWDTMLAKAPQIMLFQYSDMIQPAFIGDRSWGSQPTTFTTAGLDKWRSATGVTGKPTFASAAGYALNEVNAVLGKLGKPVGIASYKPYQSTGEDFLQNYLGMIGIPIEIRPTFPSATEAHTVLLTEQAKADPQIVSKIRKHLEEGGNVVITANLLKALEGHGSGGPDSIESIAELHYTGNVLRIDHWWSGYGAGAGFSLGDATGILIPEIQFQTNDAWPIVRGTASGRGAPILLMDKFSKGILYVLTVPENASDLYALPQPVLAQLRQYLMVGFPVVPDAPAKVSLFAYDNSSFVVESFLDAPQTVTVSAAGRTAHLRNIATGAVIDGKPMTAPSHRRAPERTQFTFTVQPHSFVAFALE